MLRLGPKNLFTKKSVTSTQSRQINIFGYDLFGKKDTQSAPREPSFAQQHQQNTAPKSVEQQREEMRATNKFYQKAKARKIPVRHIIAISSGKGGVGKSTVAVNVACGLAQLGVKVGLFDGDVHSPSISTMMNLKDPQKEILYNEETHTNTMNAPENYGVKVMSIGFLKPEGKAVIWKGPLAHFFLDQMISMVNWGADGELDYLIVDFPPGTGDVQLSLCQLMNFEAAIIVTTPQDIALKDVQRGIDMFFNLQIPVMGVVENMSHYECSKCGHKDHVFGEDISNKLEFLGKNLRPFARIPLHMDVSVTSDKGTPIVLSKPDSPIGRTYRQIAESIHKGIQEKFYEKGASSQQTKFVVEE